MRAEILGLRKLNLPIKKLDLNKTYPVPSTGLMVDHKDPGSTYPAASREDLVDPQELIAIKGPRITGNLPDNPNYKKTGGLIKQFGSR
jgi:hypothetical protein